MRYVVSSLAFAGLLQLATSLTLPHGTRVQDARSAAAPAMPTTTLVSDFQKNNVSAIWAPSYPKQWGTEDANYGYSYAAAITADEQTLVCINETHYKIVSLASNATIATGKIPYEGTADQVTLLPSPLGGYELLIEANNYSTWSNSILHNKISANGTLVSGQWTQYEGRWPERSSTPISKTGRRFLAVTNGAPNTPQGKHNPVYVYNLDSLNLNFTIETGHTDWILGASISPDDKYISTASWDGTGKLFDASTGGLLHTWGPFKDTYENETYTQQLWLTNFSPDGKYVTLAVGGGSKNTQFNVYSLSSLNSTTKGSTINDPVYSMQNLNYWAREAAWSPDSSLLAFGYGHHIYVYSFAQKKLVQHWEKEASDTIPYELTFLDDGKVLGYRVSGGLEAYGFDSNLKYRWGPGNMDRYDGASGEGVWWLQKRGLFGGVDADGKVRLWKAPAW